MQQSLYHDRLLALARFARGHPPLPPSQATHMAEANNPSCGDRVTLRLRIDGGKVVAVHGHIDGCAICAASTGLLLRHLEANPPFAANALPVLADEVAAWFAHNANDSVSLPLPLADLDVFAAVKHSYRNRIFCACLPFVAASRATRQTCAVK
ncbi:MAG: iron-sulfur cluster assembly scaffold protein [Proteobacteria bacterium]|nr:iron-sulfur cluster assembly scaffold protein [Pseudomonadota bacterium]